MVALFPLFMVAVSGRMIPMQALLTTLPPAERRGAFLSVNSAIQSLGSGTGAWLGGLLLSTSAQGQIHGYGSNGWCAVALLVFTMVWIGRIQTPLAASAPTAASRP
jgi:predicted MFS family arabinose efflux permease